MICPGDPSGSPDVFLDAVIFIDNAYFLRLKKYFFTNLKYSLRKFVEFLCRKNGFTAKNIFLYDAPPFQSDVVTKDEKKKKVSYDRFVFYIRKEGIVVREGRTQRIKSSNEFIYRQKGVDVLMAIDLVGVLNDFPNIENVILLTGDSDFVPVVEKLKKNKINVFLFTYFDRKRKSPFSRCNELIKSVSKFFIITKQDFEKSKEVKNA